MHIDILKSINGNEISKYNAYKLLDKIIANPIQYAEESEIEGNRVNMAAIIGMDNYEYTAFCHGAGLLDISSWRYKGWPTRCFKTGKLFNYKNYGWRIVTDKKEQSRIVLL
jgi:hypothetical protein